jgi:hypothetical protein
MNISLYEDFRVLHRASGHTSDGDKFHGDGHSLPTLRCKYDSRDMQSSFLTKSSSMSNLRNMFIKYSPPSIPFDRIHPESNNAVHTLVHTYSSKY